MRSAHNYRVALGKTFATIMKAACAKEDFAFLNPIKTARTT